MREGVPRSVLAAPDRATDSPKYDAMEYYDTIVGSYEELYGGEQRAKYAAAVRTKPGRVLDVGCGVGLLYDYLREVLGAEPEIYVGLDVSSESLRVLRLKHRASGIVEVVAADADLPPLREGAGFTHLYAFTLYACDYGDVRPVLERIGTEVLEEAAVTVMCAGEGARCPEGFENLGYVGRLEVLCVLRKRVPPGGFEPPTPRSPGGLQPGALPG